MSVNCNSTPAFADAVETEQLEAMEGLSQDSLIARICGFLVLMTE